MVTRWKPDPNEEAAALMQAGDSGGLASVVAVEVRRCGFILDISWKETGQDLGCKCEVRKRSS